MSNIFTNSVQVSRRLDIHGRKIAKWYNFHRHVQIAFTVSAIANLANVIHKAYSKRFTRPSNIKTRIIIVGSRTLTHTHTQSFLDNSNVTTLIAAFCYRRESGIARAMTCRTNHHRAITCRTNHQRGSGGGLNRWTYWPHPFQKRPIPFAQ